MPVRYCHVNPTAKSIVLIGMMGAGKSSVGCCLQRRMKLPVVEIDDIVASKFGMTISEIFAEHGEDQFREAEAEVLRNLKATDQAIIVTGGGIVLGEENMDLLRRLGVVVWLDGDGETLFRRALCTGNRPLLQGENRKNLFEEILRTRRPLYAKIAHLRIDTSVLTDEEVAVAILSKVEKHNRPRQSPIPVTAHE